MLYSNHVQRNMYFSKLFSIPHKVKSSYTSCIAFTPDGKKAVVGAYKDYCIPDNEQQEFFKIIDIEKQTCSTTNNVVNTIVDELNFADHCVDSVTFSNDGQFMLTLSGDTLILWNAKTFQHTHIHSCGCQHCDENVGNIMFSPLNNIILYTNTIKVGATRIKELYDTELFLYDLDFTLIYKKTLKSIVIKSAKFSTDGNYIFLEDDDMYESLHFSIKRFGLLSVKTGKCFFKEIQIPDPLAYDYDVVGWDPQSQYCYVLQYKVKFGVKTVRLGNSERIVQYQSNPEKKLSIMSHLNFFQFDLNLNCSTVEELPIPFFYITTELNIGILYTIWDIQKKSHVQSIYFDTPSRYLSSDKLSMNEKWAMTHIKGKGHVLLKNCGDLSERIKCLPENLSHDIWLSIFEYDEQYHSKHGKY